MSDNASICFANYEATGIECDDINPTSEWLNQFHANYKNIGKNVFFAHSCFHFDLVNTIPGNTVEGNWYTRNVCSEARSEFVSLDPSTLP